MPTEEARTRRFACVIECLPPDGVQSHKIETFEELQTCCKELEQNLPCLYWAIIHDMDELEDGQRKRPHIHLVIETNTRHTFLGVIRAISQAFLVDQNRVSVRQCRDQMKAIRYLMHLDDPEKALYNPFDVANNCSDGLSQAVACPERDLTIDQLVDYIRKSKNPLELAQKIGLKNYNRYRSTIRDLWEYTR